jgi:hypothetical protein
MLPICPSPESARRQEQPAHELSTELSWLPNIHRENYRYAQPISLKNGDGAGRSGAAEVRSGH